MFGPCGRRCQVNYYARRRRTRVTHLAPPAVAGRLRVEPHLARGVAGARRAAGGRSLEGARKVESLGVLVAQAAVLRADAVALESLPLGPCRRAVRDDGDSSNKGENPHQVALGSQFCKCNLLLVFYPTHLKSENRVFTD